RIYVGSGFVVQSLKPVVSRSKKFKTDPLAAARRVFRSARQCDMFFVSLCSVATCTGGCRFAEEPGSMKSTYNGKAIPADGKPIGYNGGELQVPDAPIIPYIEGDGTGRDIWKASQRVFDAAVEHAYGGKRRVAWFEVFGGEKAFNAFNEWLPNDTVEAIRDFR